jgi:hypothetical protein
VVTWTRPADDAQVGVKRMIIMSKATPL